MPEKQPDIYNIIWASICQYVSQNQYLLTGMIIAGVLSFARVMSDKKKDTFWGVIFEVLTCVFFVGGAFELLDNLGLSQDWYRAIAVGVGVYGMVLIRQLSNYILKKWGLKDENQ